MFCRNCGAQNDDQANFCEKCGAKMVKITHAGQQGQSARQSQNDGQQGQSVQQSQNDGQQGPSAQQSQNDGGQSQNTWQQNLQGGFAQNEAYQQKAVNEKKKKTGKMIAVILVLVIIIAAVLTAGFFVLKSKREKKQYADAIDQAYKYLEEMDYEKAEDAFLKAISIAPKEAEPYTALADVYLAQDETDKAVEILEQAAENVPEEELTKADSETVQDGENTSDASKKSIANKLEEVKKLGKYTWVVEPEVEADDIYYLPYDELITNCRNDVKKQFMSDYAAVRQGDSYSLIGMDGKLADDMIYRIVSRFGNFYILMRKEAKYESEYRSMWDRYTLQDGEIVPLGGLGSGAPVNEYYYYEGLQNTMEMYADSFRDEYKEEPENPIPVQEADKVMTAGLPYALYADGKLVTDFEYEDMCSWSEGLIGVKKDGKWGYINEKGEIVIPLEYDSSWVWPWDNGGSGKLVYAVSEGYIPLCKDGVWEMRDVTGELVITPGVFEQICPVYEGKCWVKRDGKWGVIQFETADEKQDEEKKQDSGEKDAEDTQENDKKKDNLLKEPIDYETAYGSVLDQLYEDYNIYYKYDIDKDGIDEILVQVGTCEADYVYEIYTIEDGEGVHLGSVPGGHTAFYGDEKSGEEPYIYHVMGHMGAETVWKLSIEDGKIVEKEQYSKEIGADESYFQTNNDIPWGTLDDRSLLK